MDLGICGKELSQVNICLNVGHVAGTESRTRSLDSIIIYFWLFELFVRIVVLWGFLVVWFGVFFN